MSDQDRLDSFLESAGVTAEPAPEVVNTPAPETPAPESAQPRDEAGRFANKQPDQSAAEQPQQPEPAPTAQPDNKTVPLDALTAVRGENRELRQQLQQLQTAMQTLQQRPAQPEQPQPKREFWDDPNAFVADQLTPYQQALAEQNARISRVLAVQEFGRETVVAAHEAVNEAIANGQLDKNVVNGQLAKSRDPVGDIVRWHKGQQAKANMQRIGDNPDAWLEAELEKRMADPAFQAKVIERARGNAAQPAGQNTQSPPVALPPSLSKIASGANAATDPDGSSEGLFTYATAGMR